MARQEKLARSLVVCGPSGSGKSTLLKLLMHDYPDEFGFSVSHTTRQPRSGEIDGQHYYFTNNQDMQNAISDGQFLEYATFCNNMYGTSRSAVESVISSGKVCVLDIDTQGVKQVKQSGLSAWYIFIKPPSLDDLKSRLIARQTETPESLDNRLKMAEQEIIYGTTPGNFDLVLINDDLKQAYNIFRNFIEDNILVRLRTGIFQ